MNRFIVGVTGGIGSGKDTVAREFARLGAGVVDTDLIARRLTVAGGRAMSAISRQFGPAVLAADGALDRSAMRRLVFADAAARKALESILHPLIGEEAMAESASSTAPYVLLLVPLLVETGNYRDRVARILVIDCAEETQVARVMRRDQLSEAEVRAIMATQASRASRLAVADDVVHNEGDNEGDWQSVQAAVAALHARYLDHARPKSAGAGGSEGVAS